LSASSKGAKITTSVNNGASSVIAMTKPSSNSVRQKGFLKFDIEFSSVVQESRIRALSSKEVADMLQKRHRAEVELSRLKKLMEVGVLKDNPEDKAKISSAENDVAELSLASPSHIISRNRMLFSLFSLFNLIYFFLACGILRLRLNRFIGILEHRSNVYFAILVDDTISFSMYLRFLLRNT
jgi:hypothetical protein